MWARQGDPDSADQGHESEAERARTADLIRLTPTGYESVLDARARDSVHASLDVVTCISVLEQIPDHACAVHNMLSHLALGRRCILTCPYSGHEHRGNVYREPESSYGRGNPYVCQSYSRVELDGWLRDSGARVITQEYWQFFDGRLWTFGAAVPPRRTSAEGAHQHTCLLIGRD
jgi:hypothetical protein